MKYKVLLSCLILFFACPSFSQFKSIKVGDNCPDIQLKIVNYPKEVLKISDFKGKILILDFWATWCVPCLSSFPKLDSLQSLFNSEIQILPVSYQDAETVKLFLEKMKNVRGVKIPSVVSDSLLHNYFPHNEIPHCVWIDEKGKVISITAGDQVTQNNIQRILHGEKLVMMQHTQMIKEIGYIGFENVFFTPVNRIFDKYGNVVDSESVAKNDVFYKSIITRHRDNYPLIQGFDSCSISACNATIENLYMLAYYNKMDELNNSMLNFASSGRKIWDVKDKDLLELSNATNDIEAKKSNALGREWMKTHTFCYELQVPASWGSNKKHEIMLADLNRFFGALYGINGFWEKQKVKCLALICTTQLDKLKSKGGLSDKKNNPYYFYLHNMPLSELTLFLPQYLNQTVKLPIIDRTGYKNQVDLELNCKLNDLGAINAELSKYGLKFIESEMDLNIIVIKQTNTKPAQK